MKKKNLIFESALSLTISALIVKILGVVYKVPLSYMLDDRGMGYFNTAYGIYSMFYILSSSGIPKATTCINNLKQNGFAIQQYVDQNKCAIMYVDTGETGGEMSWPRLLTRDKSRSLTTNVALKWGAINAITNVNQVYCPGIAPYKWVSWKYTYACINDYRVLPPDRPMTKVEWQAWRKNFNAIGNGSCIYRPQFVHNPSTFYLLGDSYSYNTAAGKTPESKQYFRVFQSSHERPFAAHNGKVSLLFGDGHVSLLDPGELGRKFPGIDGWSGKSAWIDTTGSYVTFN